MKLVYSPASPFVRKVAVVLHETGQIDDVDLLPVKTTPVSTPPEVLSANPVGKIPALVRGDGPAIYDSRVICQFLNDRAGGGLYPDTARWEVMTLEATADGILDAAVLMVYETRVRPAHMVYDDWVEAQWDKASRAVKTVNDRWMAHLTGPLNIGQIAIACALGYLDFRHDGRNWRKGNDALDDWFAVFSQRDSMTATRPSD
ncbi:putative GST-like protein YibF [Thalassovita gelatinovora]|uniref:Putative GST-like protein YibF n=1 Tax=Thalassovita gelatinovora TaxID=53501 RepID=A0A0N7LUG0_THAGE|nr:glutathione S-transferase [Thalassovita gelatinovora]QIZ80908.1 glutathione S-transferase [Thalassovita gelatinovora]CUH63394.1 putative GST-like protein YibF [Thalassovita gelatinovora]SEQ66318.1 Glutathione S-transferase [Thalassovita gelatinovora]